MSDWMDDRPVYPRVDRLAGDLTLTANLLWVEHPERFRRGDIVRIGDEDTFTCPECGCTRSRNESVLIVSGMDESGVFRIQRAMGRNPLRTARAGEPVTIISSAMAEQPEEEE